MAGIPPTTLFKKKLVFARNIAHPATELRVSAFGNSGHPVWRSRRANETREYRFWKNAYPVNGDYVREIIYENRTDRLVALV